MAERQARTFPDGFLWGVATSAHQCEGGNTNNQWYAWERAGHIKTGESCGRACDWWVNAERDFDAAARMGLNALCLSLEWSRIEPSPGQWDDRALARYRQMLAALRARGIEPVVTLHHFTHPLWFEERGAFLAPGAIPLFARYTAKVVEELGGLCDFWCTFNEPNVYAIRGYQLGGWPPGRAGDLRGAARVLANMARAHAAAYHQIHHLQPTARAGWAQHYNLFDPAHSWSPLDRLVAGVQDSGFNEAFSQAVLRGRLSFPFNLLSGDLKDVRGTCDYVGIHCYARDLVAFDLRCPAEVFGRRFPAPGSPQGDVGAEPVYGEMYPQGILRVAQRVRAFGKPIYVLENGVADASDRLRPWVIARALQAVHDALDQGIDMRGYFHWSLVDNFEWDNGWSMRFGLIALDERTQARAPRPSAAFYSEIARANALTAEMVKQHAPSALDQVFG
jgi:beta-glucosidase